MISCGIRLTSKEKTRPKMKQKTKPFILVPQPNVAASLALCRSGTDDIITIFSLVVQTLTGLSV